MDVEELYEPEILKNLEEVEKAIKSELTDEAISSIASNLEKTKKSVN